MGTEHVVPAVLSRWGRRAANKKKGAFYPMPKRGVGQACLEGVMPSGNPPAA